MTPIIVQRSKLKPVAYNPATDVSRYAYELSQKFVLLMNGNYSKVSYYSAITLLVEAVFDMRDFIDLKTLNEFVLEFVMSISAGFCKPRDIVEQDFRELCVRKVDLTVTQSNKTIQ